VLNASMIDSYNQMNDTELRHLCKLTVKDLNPKNESLRVIFRYELYKTAFILNPYKTYIIKYFVDYNCELYAIALIDIWIDGTGPTCNIVEIEKGFKYEFHFEARFARGANYAFVAIGTCDHWS